jgi:hypothetical protein
MLRRSDGFIGVVNAVLKRLINIGERATRSSSPKRSSFGKKGDEG